MPTYILKTPISLALLDISLIKTALLKSKSCFLNKPTQTTDKPYYQAKIAIIIEGIALANKATNRPPIAAAIRPFALVTLAASP